MRLRFPFAMIVNGKEKKERRGENGDKDEVLEIRIRQDEEV